MSEIIDFEVGNMLFVAIKHNRVVYMGKDQPPSITDDPLFIGATVERLGFFLSDNRFIKDQDFLKVMGEYRHVETEL